MDKEEFKLLMDKKIALVGRKDQKGLQGIITQPPIQHDDSEFVFVHLNENDRLRFISLPNKVIDDMVYHPGVNTMFVSRLPESHSYVFPGKKFDVYLELIEARAIPKEKFREFLERRGVSVNDLLADAPGFRNYLHD